MQKIFFHKTVSLDTPLKELVSISVDESIQYKLEVNGMRAFGAIVIHGEYDDGNGRKQFKENIDLDILAQSNKIMDKRDFQMKVEDFDYSITEGLLKLVIQTHIYGVKDDEDKHIHVNKEIIKEEPMFESLLRQEDQKVIEPEIVEEITTPPIQEEPKKIEKIEDDEDDDIGTYYFYVVQSDDNYGKIAERYQIDEDILYNYNQQREVKEGSIVIVPYLS